MKSSQARGYILEIVIAKLIEINGYENIYSADGDEIISKPNGLNLKGRGGYHQFDTLGKFKITPPFIYPLRLFVEAKFYMQTKVGIDRVRMGVGILEDVNANYSTVQMSSEELSVTRYQYNYAIFSTSGFTEDAQRFAIAHKIHLIDLSGSEYKDITDSIIEIVEELKGMFQGEHDEIPNEIFTAFKKQFSDLLKGKPNEIAELYNNEIYNLAMTLKRNLEGKYLYLATVNSPFIISLFSDCNFNESLRINPHQDVTITWNGEQPTEWTIALVNGSDIKIKFKLPQLLQDYMFSEWNHEKKAAIIIKERMLGKFTFIAYLDGNNPTLCTLTFDKNETLSKTCREDW